MQAKVAAAHPQPNVLEFACTMRSLKRNAEGREMEVEAKHGIIAPFEMFNFLWPNYPESFRRRLLGGAGAQIDNAADVLRNFWSEVPDSDQRKREMAE